MNREINRRIIKKIPDLFDEALELEATSVPDDFPEQEFIEAPVRESAAPVTEDPTFFDEQVINVPIIDPPDMKNISSYPDTQIYDHLFSLDDDLLLEEDIPDEAAQIFPEPETERVSAPKATPLPAPKPAPLQAQKKVGKKPRVKRAGEPEEEAPAEVTQPAEPAEAPVRKKPRVKRAGEKAPEPVAVAAAVETVEPVFDLSEEEEAFDELAEFMDVEDEAAEAEPAGTGETPPIALMNVGSPRTTPEKKTAGTQKRHGTKPGAKSKAKAALAKKSSRPRRPQAEEAEEIAPAPEKKAAKKKLPFSPLEKMKQKLAQKWS